MPVRRIIDEYSSELVEVLREAIHSHWPVSDLMEEPLLVGADVYQCHVEISWCENHLSDVISRGHEILVR